MKNVQKTKKELIEALETGEKSGFVEDFDPIKKLFELHRRTHSRKKI